MIEKITQYETRDGKLWDNYEDAKAHETTLNMLVFNSAEEMWKYVEKTPEWDEWLSRYHKDEPDIYFAEDEVNKVGEKLSLNHPKVVIRSKEKGYQRKMNWSDFIWMTFQDTVMFDYFKSRIKNIYLEDEQVYALCRLAKREAYSHSSNDIMDVFEGLIEAASIIAGE